MRRVSLGLLLALIFVNVSCTGTTKSSPGSTPPAQITVSVTPTAANVRAGAGQPFTASVSGTTNHGVTWSVNGVVGGNATVGLITNTGVYTAPAVPTNPDTITISAASVADSGASGTSDVTLWNATPVLSNVSPATLDLASRLANHKPRVAKHYSLISNHESPVTVHSYAKHTRNLRNSARGASGNHGLPRLAHRARRSPASASNNLDSKTSARCRRRP